MCISDSILSYLQFNNGNSSNFPNCKFVKPLSIMTEETLSISNEENTLGKNDAGVDIYAFKPNYFLRKGNNDADINYAMQAGKTLGASHVTLELPEDSNHSLRLGCLEEKKGIRVAYHGHEQQHAHWWDIALKQSSHLSLIHI